MDKKKALIGKIMIVCLLIVVSAASVCAQSVNSLKFCDKKYEYGEGKDSITLFFNVFDAKGDRIQDITKEQLNDYLVIREEGHIITPKSCSISTISTGQRIPAEFTFSVLVDLTIPSSGKSKIYEAISQLVESAPTGSVYLSFFGDAVTSSSVVTSDNLKGFSRYFIKDAENKCFYGALYAKIAEFSTTKAALEDEVIKSLDYTRVSEISERAYANPDKNILFVFTEGNKSPMFENQIAFREVTGYQQDISHIVPTVYAFYYTEKGEDAAIEDVLKAVCDPHVSGRIGAYMPANNMNQVLADFQKVVNDQMYDYAFTYKAFDSKFYSGRTQYTAEWKGDKLGSGEFGIGTAENPWPSKTESTTDSAIKYLVALIAALFTIALFVAIVKILIPYCQSKSFEVKYYKKYVPDAKVSRRICHYCRQEIIEGQSVVVRCKHIMHVHCWQQNGYKCAEYGQNCKTGIQNHVEWNSLISLKTLRDCTQTITGILAGFLSWVLYELGGRGLFESLAQSITDTFYSYEEGMVDLTRECVSKTSAFLTIGLLLGFFLSLFFRYNDEYRKKNLQIILKIIGLSILSCLVGLVAFVIGAVIMCSWVSALDATYIPWYCSFPAYLLFSLGISATLTIQSSIPMKSAMLGGGCSAVIGFVVLYFSGLTSNHWGWMNMLLDFVIYGGGLGASIVTVRMLAEKYYLVIQNGLRSGLRIPIHKWMNATGGGNKVSLGMNGDCEIQMNWEKSNKVAKEHVQLYIDRERQLPMLKPLATNVMYNNRVELPVGKPMVLTTGDVFKVGDTNFQYVETD